MGRLAETERVEADAPSALGRTRDEGDVDAWLREPVVLRRARRFDRLRERSPELKSRFSESRADAYPHLRDRAADGTHVPADEFPAERPYTGDAWRDRPFDFDSSKI